MKNKDQAFGIWQFRKAKLKTALRYTRGVKNRKRIIMICYELQCRKDNLLCANGGSLPNFNIFSHIAPIWG